MKKKIEDMSAEELLSLVSYFANTACDAMDNEEGLRTGSYIRKIKNTLDAAQIIPSRVDDDDIQNGIIYLADA